MSRSKEAVAVFMLLMGMKAGGRIEEDVAEQLDQAIDEAFAALEKYAKRLEMSLDSAQGESSGFRGDVNKLLGVMEGTMRYSERGKVWVCLFCQHGWREDEIPTHKSSCPIAGLPEHLKPAQDREPISVVASEGTESKDR